MGREIERKFRTRGDAWRRAGGEQLSIRQGYLVAEEERSARVRVVERRSVEGRRVGSEATLTLKGRSRGATRSEYEYPIPVPDAERILEELCLRPLIEKIRHRVEHAGRTWEIDEFHGENEGLVVAELELASEDERPELPEWVGEEVTRDPRYLNANLVRSPYREWKRGRG